jgi:hypothetical protein
MPWPPSRQQLLNALARTERHIASVAESVERQQHTIAQLEAAGRGTSETAETLRALLASMQKSHAFYVRERGRITRLITTSNQDG